MLRSLVRSVFAVVVVCAMALAASHANAALGECSQPLTEGAIPVATDCLFILNAAVGLQSCSRACICDPSGDDTITAVDALTCLAVVVGAEVGLACPCDSSTTTTTTSTTTTTTIAPSGPDCPVVVEDTYYAGAGAPCVTNADCAVGRCDADATGRCVTPTRVDLGWAGIMHLQDHLEGYEVDLKVACGSGPAPCGTCRIEGIRPTPSNCRCAGDNAVPCDEPFQADLDDCGGQDCDCYLGPPVPHSAGNTPSCMIHRLASDLSGAVNVDTGARALSIDARWVRYLGENLVMPCPFCTGDVLANDGVRDGTCVRSADAGDACDVHALSYSFPAPGGDGHSLDCFPRPGTNVSGFGLKTRMRQATGEDSLGSNVECGFPPFVTTLCHCGLCSEDQSEPCTADSDCDSGTCEMDGAGAPLPNQCSGDAVCEDIVEGRGTCAEGPIDHLCDGIVRADGGGFIGCLSNLDCEPGTIGIDAGSCTLSRTRSCFAPTILATGVADPAAPITDAVFCWGVGSNPGAWHALGFPGPMRVREQLTTQAYCDEAKTIPYVAGVGCEQ
jgi:hypothetical protein